MYPILFKIGPIPIHTFGILHGLAFLVGVWWLYREARRHQIDTQKIYDLAIVIFIWSLVGSRVFSILFDGNLKWYLQHPMEMIAVWKGGLTFYGGFLFGIAAGLWYIKKHHLNGWQIADFTVPGLALAGAIGRLGCLASGDSFGKPTNLPWAISFSDPHSLAPLNVPLHPTQLYSVLTNLAIFGVLLFWRKRQKAAGELSLLYLLLYAVTRSFVEVFRDDPRGVYFNGLISTSQIISLFVVLFTIVLFFFWLKQKPRESSI